MHAGGVEGVDRLEGGPAIARPAIIAVDEQAGAAWGLDQFLRPGGGRSQDRENGETR